MNQTATSIKYYMKQIQSTVRQDRFSTLSDTDSVYCQTFQQSLLRLYITPLPAQYTLYGAINTNKTKGTKNYNECSNVNVHVGRTTYPYTEFSYLSLFGGRETLPERVVTRDGILSDDEDDAFCESGVEWSATFCFWLGRFGNVETCADFRRSIETFSGRPLIQSVKYLSLVVIIW